jgi:hypothetical protein
MAGDWIKIEHSLPSKPEVIQMADILGISEEEVVGHLVRFWSWADQNLSRDCPDTSGTRRGLDRVACRDGFVDAMIAVGWLEFDGQTVRVPNYESHLSQSAKQRGLESRKKNRQRQMSRKTSRDCPDTSGTPAGQNTGPEKRREEYTDIKGGKGKFEPPTVNQVAEYAPDIDAEHFWHHHHSRGWVLSNGKKMKDWKSAVVTWRKNGKNFNRKDQPPTQTVDDLYPDM